MKVSQLK